MFADYLFSEKSVFHFFFVAMLFSFCAFAEQTVLYPQNAEAKRGENSLDQPISVLSVKDQSNQNDDRDKYMNFAPDRNRLVADFSNHVGCNIFDSKKAYSLIKNGCLRGANMFQGEQYATQEQVWHPTITPQDMDDLRANNANYVNFSVPGPYDVEAPYKKRDDFFEKLDQLIGMAEQADLFVILSFRTGPGRGEGDITAEAGSKFNKELFKKRNWRSKEAFVRMWKDVASRYSGNKHIVGYDILVEPHDVNRNRWRNLAQKTVNAIRLVDKHTPILISPDDWGVASSLDNWKPITGDNLVYTVHQYEPYGYTHNNEPAKWRSGLESIYSKIESWVNRYKKPIFVNEYGLSVNDDSNILLDRDPNFMRVQIKQLEKSHFSHAAWIWEVEYDPEYTYQEFDFKDDSDISESIYNAWQRNIIFPSMIQ